MTSRTHSRRSGPTGRIRFVASLGVAASLLVGVTAAVVTDNATAEFTPVGGKFDVAFLNTAGQVVNGGAYVVPESDIVGVIYPADSPSVIKHAYFPLRITNVSTGSIPAHAVIHVESLAPENTLDVASKLEVRIANPADDATIMDWSAVSTLPSFPVDIAQGAVRTVNVQVRLVNRDQLDGRFFGVHADFRLVVNGESS